MIGGQILDQQDGVVLVDLCHGHALGRIDRTTVLAPGDGERYVALDDGTGDRSPIANVQRKDGRVERVQLRRHCKRCGRKRRLLKVLLLGEHTFLQSRTQLLRFREGGLPSGSSISETASREIPSTLVERH